MNFKVLVREDNGSKLQNRLINAADPWPKDSCDLERCFPCQPGGKKSNCWKSGINYEITCKPCLRDGRLARYIGESGRSSYSRGLEHEQNLRSLKRGQPLADHVIEVHLGMNLMQTDFDMCVTGSYKKPLPRLISEGHKLDKLLTEREEGERNVTVLNSKKNVHQSKNIKLVAVKQIY